LTNVTGLYVLQFVKTTRPTDNAAYPLMSTRCSYIERLGPMLGKCIRHYQPPATCRRTLQYISGILYLCPMSGEI